MNLFAKFFVLAVLVSMSNCVIDRKDDGIPDAPGMATFEVEINKITARKSCEGDGTSGVADLFTKIFFYKRENVVSEVELITESEEVLVSLKRYESITDPGIQLSADVELKDGLIISSIIITYERDGGGKKQIQRSFSQSFIYEEDLGCWLEDANACAFGTIAGSSNLIRSKESKMVDSTCDVTYAWSTSIQAQ